MLQLGYRVQYSTQVFDIIEKSLELADDKNDVLNEIERAMFFQDAFYFAKIGTDWHFRNNNIFHVFSECFIDWIRKKGNSTTKNWSVFCRLFIVKAQKSSGELL